MNWITIPPTRVLEVSIDELKTFDLLDENSQPVNHWSASSFVLAIKNKRVYRRARFRPNKDDMNTTYLEEV